MSIDNIMIMFVIINTMYMIALILIAIFNRNKNFQYFLNSVLDLLKLDFFIIGMVSILILTLNVS